jgi:ubiquitin-protein ligase
MFSKAHLIIQHEINEINQRNYGFIIKPFKEDNVFELIALINGPIKTIWEKGIFQVYLKFNEYYNMLPPEVYFQTIPFHPNIDLRTGRPSVDFLNEPSKWKSDMNIIYLLKKLQNLLANPLLDRAVNMDAVFILKDNPRQYEDIVKQSVQATHRIIKILESWPKTNTTELSSFTESIERKNQHVLKLPLFNFTKENTFINKENETEKQNRERILKSISFDEYSKLWRGIATTKSKKEDENQYLTSDVFENPNVIYQHISISVKDLEEHVYNQLNEHKNLMYGRFDFAQMNKEQQKKQKSTNLNSKLFTSPSNRDRETDIASSLQNGDENENLKTNSLMTNFNTQNNHSKEGEGKETMITAEIKSEPQIRTLMKITTSMKSMQSNEELFEKEVDELITWTQNI